MLGADGERQHHNRQQRRKSLAPLFIFAQWLEVYFAELPARMVAAKQGDEFMFPILHHGKIRVLDDIVGMPFLIAKPDDFAAIAQNHRGNSQSISEAL